MSCKSRVAHMWREPKDARTTLRYTIKKSDNAVRVATAWFDEFSKLFRNGKLPPVDVMDVLKQRKDQACKPFSYFLHRFRKVYLRGGILPEKVFLLRDKRTQQCIHRQGPNFHLKPCDLKPAVIDTSTAPMSTMVWEGGDSGNMFHLANWDQNTNGTCCSGIRQWNSLFCFDRLDHSGPLPYYCDITGKNHNQQYSFADDGRIRDNRTGLCLSTNADGVKFAIEKCEHATHWEQVDPFEPEETKLYKEAIKKHSFSEDVPDN